MSDPLSARDILRVAGRLRALANAAVPKAEHVAWDDTRDWVKEFDIAHLTPDEKTAIVTIAVTKDVADISEEDRKTLLAPFAMSTIKAHWERTPAGERRDEPLDPPVLVLAAAIRVAVGGSDEATKTLEKWVTKGEEEVPDAHDGGGVLADDVFVFEERGLPAQFDRAAFPGEVKAQLGRLGGEPSPAFLAVVVGRLVLDGNSAAGRSDFRFAVKRAYDIGVTDTGPSDKAKPNKAHYDEIANDLLEGDTDGKVRYQELAAVADHVVASAGDGWDITDDEVRRAQVRVGRNKYADGTAETGFAALAIPPAVSEDAANQELEPLNMQAVAYFAVSYELESAGVLDVVEKMLELFTNGLLPVRDDSGGRALNRYYWRTEERLDAARRADQYSRVLGHGDTGRTDWQPNSQFEPLLMRFVAALVRYDSMLQVSNVVTTDAVMTRAASSEPVRKAAQDLAANASLYGWGFTIFAARKMSRQIDEAFAILGEETLQRAYGVTGPWQLVERVSAVELGSTPAIVQHRTRAQAISDIFDVLAAHAPELARSGAVKRFLPNTRDLFSERRDGIGSSISVDDYERLVTAANNLLAVGGVTDEELSKYAAPVASAPRGSIPTVGGDGGGGTGGSGPNLDQIRQLAEQRQFDQLQRLLGVEAG